LLVVVAAAEATEVRYKRISAAAWRVAGMTWVKPVGELHEKGVEMTETEPGREVTLEKKKKEKKRKMRMDQTIHDRTLEHKTYPNSATRSAGSET
jgi:hypothetical protein